MEDNEEEILLTRTDKHGNIYPLKISGEEPIPRKKKKKLKPVRWNRIVELWAALKFDFPIEWEVSFCILEMNSSEMQLGLNLV